MDDGLEFTAQELTQASEERLAEMDTTEGGENEQPETTQVADEAEQLQDTDTSTSTLTEIDASVLESFPEAVREHVSSLPAEVVQELNKGYLRNDNFTRKAQAVAEERKEVAQSQQDAQSWRDLIANDAARKAVMKAVDAEVDGRTVEAEEFDWTTASNGEIQAEIERRALEVSKKVVHDRVDAPQERVYAIKKAALGYRNELGDAVTDATFASAWQDMIGRYGETAVTPENARHLLEPFMDIQKLKGELANGKSSMSERVDRAATTSGGSRVAPKTRPKWVAEGREPDETERMAATLDRLNEMTGTRWSESDLDDLLAQG